MKKYFVLCLIGSALSSVAVAQDDSGVPTPGRRGGFGGGRGLSASRGAAQDLQVSDTNATESLPKFDLDFRGGKPKELVQAIEKAVGRPLNVVIPPDSADAPLPPISVKGVNVMQLFVALGQASLRNEPYITSYSLSSMGRSPTYSFIQTGYGFKTTGTPTENSIWYFHWDKLPVVPGLDPDEARSRPTCRFYQLSAYLDAGYKVEDITTAIETGWKMMGETDPPRMSYHKDTKLLIAVGTDERRLSMIQDVLNHLPIEKAKPSAMAPPVLGPQQVPEMQTLRTIPPRPARNSNAQN